MTSAKSISGLDQNGLNNRQQPEPKSSVDKGPGLLPLQNPNILYTLFLMFLPMLRTNNLSSNGLIRLLYPPFVSGEFPAPSAAPSSPPQAQTASTLKLRRLSVLVAGFSTANRITVSKPSELSAQAMAKTSSYALGLRV